MDELKTTRNRSSVTRFLKSVPDVKKRRDAFALLELMKDASGEEPAMWGTSIVGFGSYRYVYESGREGDWPLTGFSPRKQNLTIYIMPGFREYEGILEKLGKHTTGKSCLYIKSLDDVHLPTLKQLIARSVKHMRKKAW